MIYKFAVCDDEETTLAAVSGAIVNVFVNNGAGVTVDSFLPSKNLFDRLMEKDYNAVFLDINMAGTDGIELGKKLKAVRSELDIIFVSGEEGRVFESFEVHPYGFVRKSKFLKDIADLAKIYIADHLETGESMVALKSGNTIHNVKAGDIVYIEAIKEYQYVHINKNKEPIKMRSSMDALEEQLSSFGFIRVHKSFLVNYCCIRRIGNDEILTTTEERVPVSRRKLQETREKYMEFSRKNGSFHLR